MIYLDHAASSHPKPDAVLDAMMGFLRNVGANPGRSGHRLSGAAARIVFEARESVARLLGVADSRRVIFTPSATVAVNLALFGLLKQGDHVVTTSVEHNAVARPLARLSAERAVTVTPVPTDGEGLVDSSSIRAGLTDRTRLVVVAHASNVLGTVQPLAEIKDVLGTVPLLVDAAQTAGATPIDVDALGADLLAFTGHKALLGPQGTGGLVLSSKIELSPLVYGGTGSRSESDLQPDFLPDRFESGTSNTPGIAGLGAACSYLLARGIEAQHREAMERFGRFLEKMRRIPDLVLYGREGTDARLALASFNIRGKSPSDVGRMLDERYGIMVRVGLHCAPWAHKRIGTFPSGTIRIAAGASTSDGDLDQAVEAIAEIARS
jgi:cysteine desulfurase family protein